MQRNMIAAVLLLCAVRALWSNVSASSPEAPFFRAVDYLNASDTISKVLTGGEKLNISLEDLPGSSVCHWIRGKDQIMTTNGSQFMVTPPLSETDSGVYTLTCESSSANKFNMTVFLRVVMKRPTKPQLMLDGVERRMISPLFKCISEGSPNPTIQWSGAPHGAESKTSKGRTESTISSIKYHEARMMCCATNAEGQECSQMYDYDLESKNEVSNITVSKNQSLLLRCRMREYSPSPVWEKEGKLLDAGTLSCKSEMKEEELCIKNDGHYKSAMAYLSIRSVREEHSGTYTCKGPNRNPKSFYVHVLDKDFLSAQLDEHMIIKAEQASSTCLQASVSYHPVLQHCLWETPDKNMIKCVRQTWVTQHRTVKLCDQLISGYYKLHLEAGGQKETKNISVCVGDLESSVMNKDEMSIVTWSKGGPTNYKSLMLLKVGSLLLLLAWL